MATQSVRGPTTPGMEKIKDYLMDDDKPDEFYSIVRIHLYLATKTKHNNVVAYRVLHWNVAHPEKFYIITVKLLLQYWVGTISHVSVLSPTTILQMKAFLVSKSVPSKSVSDEAELLYLSRIERHWFTSPMSCEMIFNSPTPVNYVASIKIMKRTWCIRKKCGGTRILSRTDEDPSRLFGSDWVRSKCDRETSCLLWT